MATSIRGNSCDDFMASFLRTRISTLIDILRDFEEGNQSSDYADENIKNVIKDLMWFRKQYFKT